MLATTLLALFALQEATKPLAGKQLDEAIGRYFAADARTEAGFAERTAILKELERVPALTAAQEKSWRDKLLKLASKSAREIDKDTGAQWFWPEDKKGKTGRGLFIVGGNTKKPKGLLIGLHGGGAGAGDAWSAHGALNSVASNFDWLGIYPEVLVKTEHGWTDSGTEEFVLDLIEAAVAAWKIDRDHIYFSGHSMGGYGSWTLGAHHADMVAGLAPSAGAPTAVTDAGGKVSDIDWGVVPNLRNVPIRIYQSDDDPNVPPLANRVAVEKLKQAKELHGGFDFEYWEVSGRAHDAPPGGMEALVAKIADKERNARPAKVLWQPTLAWKRQSYWLWWDAPTPHALIIAELDAAKNEVRVQCDGGAQGLCVLLDDALVDLDRPVAVFHGSTEVFRGLPQRTLATLVLTAARNDPALLFSARVPLAAEQK